MTQRKIGGNADRHMTCKEVAQVMGLSPQRVTQIEHEALRKVRDRLLRDPQVRELLCDLGYRVSDD